MEFYLSSQQGIVLITCLLFLLLLTVLSMSGIEISLLEMKMSQHWHKTYGYLEATENALRLGEKALMHDQYAQCHFLTPQPVNYFQAKSLTWWRYNGCYEHIAGVDHYYVIEDLTSDSCGYISNSAAATGIAYYRITAKANLADTEDSNPVVLQSTFVTPSPANCNAIRHPVQAGRQAWRQW